MKTLLSLALATSALASPATAADLQSFQVEKGHYQAILGDCAACHSKAGGKLYSGGEPLETPFGTLVPPNITPDRETGIGAWTKADFRNTMKNGVGKDGKHLYPAMPYPSYHLMPDEDVDDLWAYLQTVEPVHHAVEANQLPFPFNQRIVMRGWNWLNFEPEPFQPDEKQSAEWNRGAYLVQGPGHCGTCHTPKSALGADESDAALQGATLQGWYAPNITGQKRIGIGDWSKNQIVAYLKTGSNGHAIAAGPMVEAIQDSTSQMKDDDLQAIATYLLSVKADDEDGGGEQPKPLASDDSQMKAGAEIYRTSCAACHGMDGKGAEHLFPALAGSAAVQQDDVSTLIHVILAGAKGPYTKDRPTAPAMPSFAFHLSDEQVADVATYIRNDWGNAAPAVSADAVGDARGAD
ncbi:cytochrome c [Jiella mangrovi]|uniref:Cytochrome c n=1 Tax=Jiella mangrovi TaxID=2821407 RepID=A0ABS4BKC6_9HYPH|nr:cytochrome c [Jiella mangrovi]MBP0616459.1 cytochrome c [Jiella mangrovi]